MDIPVSEYVADRIKEIRLSKDIKTIREFADLLCRFETEVRRIESGKHKISVDVLVEVAIALETPFSHFLPKYKGDHSVVGVERDDSVETIRKNQKDSLSQIGVELSGEERQKDQLLAKLRSIQEERLRLEAQTKIRIREMEEDKQMEKERIDQLLAELRSMREERLRLETQLQEERDALKESQVRGGLSDEFSSHKSGLLFWADHLRLSEHQRILLETLIGQFELKGKGVEHGLQSPHGSFQNELDQIKQKIIKVFTQKGGFNFWANHLGLSNTQRSLVEELMK